MNDKKNWNGLVGGVVSGVTALLSLILIALRVYKEYQESPVPVIVLVTLVVLGGVVIICVYVLAATRKSEIVAGEQRPRFGRRWRILAGIVVAAIFVCSAAYAFHGIDKSKGNPTFVVLVADFDDSSPRDYGVTSAVVSSLRDALHDRSRVTIKVLPTGITADEGPDRARTAGRENGASIVIWGWYESPGDVVAMNVNFDVLESARPYGDVTGDYLTGMQIISIKELSSFSFQAQLSSELTGLTLFTLGVLHLSEGDYPQAIDLLTACLAKPALKDRPGVGVASLYFRGIAHRELGSLLESEADFTRVIEAVPTTEGVLSKLEVLRESVGSMLGDEDEVERLAALRNADVPLDESLEILGIAWNDIPADLEEWKRLIGESEHLGDYYRAWAEVERFRRAAFAHRGVVRLSAGELGGAIRDFSTSVKLGFAVREATLNKTAALQQIGDCEGALEEAESILEQDQNDVRGLVARAKVHFDCGRIEASLEDFERVRSLEPDLIDAILGAASVWSLRERYKLASQLYGEAVYRNPRDPEAYLARGCFLLSRGDYTEAKADIKAALTLDSSEWRYWYSLGITHQKSGDADLAIAAFSEAIISNPTAAEALICRSAAYREVGEDGLATIDSNRAVQLKPYLGEMNLVLWKGCCQKEKAIDKAIAEYSVRLRTNPCDDGALFNRALHFRRKGNRVQALDDLRSSLECQPNNPIAYLWYGLILHEQNHFAAAVEYLKRAIELDPSMGEAHYRRGLAQMALGLDDVAARDLQRSLQLSPDAYWRSTATEALEGLFQEQ